MLTAQPIRFLRHNAGFGKLMIHYSSNAGISLQRLQNLLQVWDFPKTCHRTYLAVLQCWIVQFFSQSPRLKINFALRFFPLAPDTDAFPPPFLNRISPRTCARRQMRWQKTPPCLGKTTPFPGRGLFLHHTRWQKKHLQGRAGFFPPTIVLAKKHFRRRASFSRVAPKAGRKKSSAGKKTPSPFFEYLNSLFPKWMLMESD